MSIITISRGSKSGGAKLARELQKILGFNVLSREDAAAEAAKRYGVTAEEMVRGLAIPANFFERLTHRKRRYLLAMQATVGEVFEAEGGIYHGIAGQFLFHGLCNVFKVRLIAPMETRIRATMNDLGLTREDAERYIHEADDRRVKWVKQLFSVDINDPDLYDVIVNTDQMSVTAAAQMIGDILQREKYQPTTQCVQEFKDFALEKRVEAELFFNSPFNADVVEVAVKSGSIGLSGGKAFEATKASLVDYVSRIRGVDKVITDEGEVSSIDSTLDTDMGLSSLDTKARDVMLPLAAYPRVPFWATIREAFVAMTASTVKLKDNQILLPRYVLVHDEDNEHIVGIVSRRELLKGIIPHYRQHSESERHIRELIPFGAQTPPELFINWTSLFTAQATEAANEPIHVVMVDLKGSVSGEDSLSTVISTMLHHGIDLVPVLDNKEMVTGVIIMTSIFDIVAQFIIEHGSPDRGHSKLGDLDG